jgi:WD40 repeat protein
VVTTSTDQTAGVWDVRTGQEVAVLKGHGGNVLRATFSPDGRQVATASVDRTARVWEAATGKQIHNLAQHTGPVRDVIFTPDGKNIVTISDDGTARLWDAATGGCIRVFEGHTGPIRSATFQAGDPDTGVSGPLLLTASKDKTVRLWSLDKSEPIDTLLGHGAAAWSIASSRDGRHVVTASDDGDGPRLGYAEQEWDCRLKGTPNP